MTRLSRRNLLKTLGASSVLSGSALVRLQDGSSEAVDLNSGAVQSVKNTQLTLMGEEPEGDPGELLPNVGSVYSGQFLAHLGYQTDTFGDPSDGIGACYRHTFVMSGLSTAVYNQGEYTSDGSREDEIAPLDIVQQSKLLVDTNRNQDSSTAEDSKNVAVSARRDLDLFGFLDPAGFDEAYAEDIQLTDNTSEKFGKLLAQTPSGSKENADPTRVEESAAPEDTMVSDVIWGTLEGTVIAILGDATQYSNVFSSSHAIAKHVFYEYIIDQDDKRPVPFDTGFEQKFDYGDDYQSGGGHYVLFDVYVPKDGGSGTFTVESSHEQSSPFDHEPHTLEIKVDGTNVTLLRSDESNTSGDPVLFPDRNDDQMTAGFAIERDQKTIDTQVTIDPHGNEPNRSGSRYANGLEKVEWQITGPNGTVWDPVKENANALDQVTITPQSFGTYTVLGKFFGANDQQFIQKTFEVTYRPDAEVTAPSSAAVSEDITLDASDSIDPDNPDDLSYSWRIMRAYDGGPKYDNVYDQSDDWGSTTTYTFDEADAYRVEVGVSDPQNVMQYASTLVEVGPTTADLSLPSNTLVDGMVAVDASGSTPSDSLMYELYVWPASQAQPTLSESEPRVTTDSPQFDISFDSAGTYDIKLRVYPSGTSDPTDDEVATSAVSQIHVQAASADLSVSDSIAVDQTIDFDASGSTPSDKLEYRWYVWPEGGTKTQVDQTSDPTTTYSFSQSQLEDAGTQTFNIEVEAYDSDGTEADTESVSRTISYDGVTAALSLPDTVEVDADATIEMDASESSADEPLTYDWYVGVGSPGTDPWTDNADATEEYPVGYDNLDPDETVTYHIKVVAYTSTPITDSNSDSASGTVTVTPGLPNQIEIQSADGADQAVHYEFTYDDNVEPTGDIEEFAVPEVDEEISSDELEGFENDPLDGVKGKVTDGGDTWAYEGEITDFVIDGPATITINDQQIDPGSIANGSATGELPRSIQIDGTVSDGTSEYSFDVTGEVHPAFNLGTVDGDTITESGVNGSVGDTIDGYWFSGDISSFDLNGGAQVLVDGEPYDPSSSAITSGATYRLMNDQTGKAADIKALSTSNGANVQQWEYVGGASQKWTISEVGNGAYKLINEHSDKALEVANWSSENGANVQQWAYGGGSSQQWFIEKTGAGVYKLTNRNSGKVLEVPWWSDDDGGNIQQWEDGGGTNQRWRLVEVSDSDGQSISLVDATIQANTSANEFTIQASVANDGSTSTTATLTAQCPNGAFPIDEETKTVNAGGTASFAYTFPFDRGLADPTIDIEVNGAYKETLTVPEVPPTATIEGPSELDIGVQGKWNAIQSRDNDGDGGIGFDWEVNGPGVDRSTDYGNRVWETFDSSGTATISVTVTDDEGQTATATKEVTINDPDDSPPVADIQGPSEVEVGTQATWDGSESYDPGFNKSITAYQWAVGGRTESGSEYTETFDTPGTVTVSLTVTDDAGQTDTATMDVEVVEPVSATEIDISPNPVGLGEETTLEAIIPDNIEVQEVKWLLHDWGTSVVGNPRTISGLDSVGNDVGTYQIELKLTYGDGKVFNKTAELVIW